MSTTPESPNPFSSPMTNPGVPQGPSLNQGMAIASLVTGILGILGSCCCVFLVPLPIVAIVLGFVALSQINAGQAGGKGMAIAGIVCGFVGIATAILGVIVGIGAQVLQQAH